MTDEVSLLRSENARLKAIIQLLTEQLSFSSPQNCANVALNGVPPGNSSENNYQVHHAHGNSIGYNYQVRHADGNSIGDNYQMHHAHGNSLGNNIQVRCADGNSFSDNSQVHFEPGNSINKQTSDYLKLVSLQLKPAMGACRTITHRNAARLLLHIQHNPQSSYKQLQAITGLSKGGLAKHLRTLIKKQLLQRTAYQHFALTTKANKVLEEVAAMNKDDVLQALFEAKGC